MAVLGKGMAHGACSLLHAAALGYGASIALDLPVTVRLLDRPSKRDVNDPDQLLKHILQQWLDDGHPLPEGFTTEDLHWGVNSKIPQKQGLKSSAAICVAAFRALSKATEVELGDADIVGLSGRAQLAAGVSMTGSIDDAWACATPGWKLVDPQAPVEEGVLLQGDGPTHEDWTVLLLIRGEREHILTFDDFEPHLGAFQQALTALQEGKELVALTWNGRGMVGALKDIEGRKMANDSFVNSARAAGLSGSGPAVAIVVSNQFQPTIERITSWYNMRYKDVSILKTTFLTNETDDELE